MSRQEAARNFLEIAEPFIIRKGYEVEDPARPAAEKEYSECIKEKLEQGISKEQLDNQREAFIISQEADTFSTSHVQEVPQESNDFEKVMVWAIPALLVLCCLACCFCCCRRKKDSEPEEPVQESRPSNEGLKKESESADDIEMAESEASRPQPTEQVF